MSESVLQLNSLPQTLTLNREPVERLLDAADAECALLYLYVAAVGGRLDVAAASVALKRTQADVRAAADRLQEMGLLVEEKKPRKLLSADELPVPDPASISRVVRQDDFQALVNETQTLLGKVLSTEELKILVNLYDYLALPPDVIMLLVHYCYERSGRRNGVPLRPSFKTIERRAFQWFDEQITTYEAAERWIADTDRRNSQVSETMRQLGIHDRQPSRTERSYIEAWLAMGFDPEAIAEAADRTIVKTGGLKWNYINAVIQSWHEKGLHTLPDIRQGDRRGKKAAVPDARETELNRQNLEDMRRLREALRKE